MSLKDRPPLHHEPPLTPAGVLLERGWPLPLLLSAFAALAIAARVEDGRLLATIDEPVTRTLIDGRSGPLDTVVKTISALGGLTVVTAVLVVVLLVVWHECRALACTSASTGAPTSSAPCSWAPSISSRSNGSSPGTTATSRAARSSTPSTPSPSRRRRTTPRPIPRCRPPRRRRNPVWRPAAVLRHDVVG